MITLKLICVLEIFIYLNGWVNTEQNKIFNILRIEIPLSFLVLNNFAYLCSHLKDEYHNLDFLDYLEFD